MYLVHSIAIVVASFTMFGILLNKVATYTYNNMYTNIDVNK